MSLEKKEEEINDLLKSLPKFNKKEKYCIKNAFTIFLSIFIIHILLISYFSQKDMSVGSPLGLFYVIIIIFLFVSLIIFLIEEFTGIMANEETFTQKLACRWRQENEPL